MDSEAEPPSDKDMHSMSSMDEDTVAAENNNPVSKKRGRPVKGDLEGIKVGEETMISDGSERARKRRVTDREKSPHASAVQRARQADRTRKSQILRKVRNGEEYRAASKAQQEQREIDAVEKLEEHRNAQGQSAKAKQPEDMKGEFDDFIDDDIGDVPYLADSEGDDEDDDSIGFNMEEIVDNEELELFESEEEDAELDKDDDAASEDSRSEVSDGENESSEEVVEGTVATPDPYADPSEDPDEHVGEDEISNASQDDFFDEQTAREAHEDAIGGLQFANSILSHDGLRNVLEGQYGRAAVKHRATHDPGDREAVDRCWEALMDFDNDPLGPVGN